MPNTKSTQNQSGHLSSNIPGSVGPTVRQLDKGLRILRMKQLVERMGLSRATLYTLMSADPTFPAKINLTVRTVGWLEIEVDAWIAARAQARRDMTKDAA